MAVADSSIDEELLIKRYFENDYKDKDIRAFLEAKHGTQLLEDQLCGRLKQLGLKPQGSKPSLEEVEAAIQISKN